MLRFLEKLNTLTVVAIILVFFVVVDGFLFYRYRQKLVEPPAAPSMNPTVTMPIKPTAAVPSSCSTAEVAFIGYSDALDERSYEETMVGGISGIAYDANRDLYYGVADSQVGSTPARVYTIEVSLEEGRLAPPYISEARDGL